MRKRTGLVGLLVGVSIALAGVAMAASTATLLVEGFDPENNTLVYGVSDIEEDGVDCTAEGSGYAYTADGAGSVTTLTKDGQPASFRLDGGDVLYGQTDGVCDLTAVDVTGPEGQVNHGQVVSSFVHAVKEQLREAGARGGIGCLVGAVARSDYGKGDQQQGPTVIDETAVVSGEVDLNAHEVNCQRGNKAEEADASDVVNSGNGPGNSNAVPNGNGSGKGKGNGNGNG